MANDMVEFDSVWVYAEEKMRLVQLLMLALLATVANADTFDITFNQVATIREDDVMLSPLFASGTIVTDGACTFCSIVTGRQGQLVRNGIEEILTFPAGWDF